MRCIDLFARGKYNIILWFYAEEESINMKNTEKSMDTLVNLCKNRGFVYAGSEIYGGLANTWDYGPLGVEPCTKRPSTSTSMLCSSAMRAGSFSFSSASSVKPV